MASNREPVRLALIGVGSIGRRHLDLMAAEPACRLAAVVDPVSSLDGIEVPCYRSHTEMLEREGPLGVIIAAPTQLHASIGLDCVKRGVPALIEKPFTDTVASGRDLVEAADAANVPIAVGHHRRFDPAVRAAHEILHSGEVGRLVGISGIWAARKPDSYYEVEWRRKPGGGPVLINLIHDIDMLRYCCGEVESVYAETSTTGRGLEVEDSGAVILRFASGARATISFADNAPSPWGWERATADNPQTPTSGQNCYRFYGTQGSFEFPNIALWRNEPGGEPSWLRSIRSDKRELPPRAALRDQLASCCRVVRGEEQPAVSARDGLATLAATTAVLESARTGLAMRPAELST